MPQNREEMQGHGVPNNVILLAEEENIGTFGRAWINAKPSEEVERKVGESFYSM